MDQPHPTYILVCESVHDVMAMEQALGNAGIATGMIPVPRELTSDCGMALEVKGALLERIREIAGAREIPLAGVYIRGIDGFSPA